MPQQRLQAGNGFCSPVVTESALSLLAVAPIDRLQKELNAMRRRRPTILVSAVAVVAASLLAAGCGGGSASPGVASVASSTTTTATTTQSGSGSGDKPFGGSGGGQGRQFQIALNTGNATLGAKFAACMRKHGVTNFPDPNSQGVITFGSGMGIDPNSPTFTSARRACAKLLPNGGQPTPQEQAQRQQEMLAFSTCMRAHGIKDFPDPTGGGLRIHVSPGSDLDPNNPQFRRAQTACQGNLPFKSAPGVPPAAGKSSGGG
jgi:hypothetical protein